jgi:hypothetical protein
MAVAVLEDGSCRVGGCGCRVGGWRLPCWRTRLDANHELCHAPLNELKDAIAVSQDPLGQMGIRLTNSSDAPTQVWSRVLANGDVAVGLYNKGGSPVSPPIPAPAECTEWTHVQSGYGALPSLPSNPSLATNFQFDYRVTSSHGLVRCAGFDRHYTRGCH